MLIDNKFEKEWNHEDPEIYLNKKTDDILKREKYLNEDLKMHLVTHFNYLNKSYQNQLIKLKRSYEPEYLCTYFQQVERKTSNGEMVRTNPNFKYKTYTIEVPWFNYYDTMAKLSKKYYKGEAYDKDHVLHNDLLDVFPNFNKREGWISPSNNPLYRWKKGWEYDVDPLDHTDLKSFIKARLKIRKKFSEEFVKAKLKEKQEQEDLAIKNYLEEQRLEKVKKKEELKKLNDKRYKSLDDVAKQPGIYVICEKRKIFTKVKNKCNVLYVGESSSYPTRIKAYSNGSSRDNELIIKLHKKTGKTREFIESKLKNNVRVRILENKFINNDEKRKQIEGYLINRLNPLLNSSKKNGYYTRSFINKEPMDNAYYSSISRFFDTEIYQFGNTETIFHIGKKRFVKRDSRDGREAEQIQYDRKFNTWIKKNNLNNRIDEWREDKNLFFENISR